MKCNRSEVYVEKDRAEEMIAFYLDCVSYNF